MAHGEGRSGLSIGLAPRSRESSGLHRNRCVRGEFGAGNTDQAHLVGVVTFMRMTARRRVGNDQQYARREGELQRQRARQRLDLLQRLDAVRRPATAGRP